MPVTKKATAKRETVAGQSGRKAPGTRLGTMLNWRSEAKRTGKTPGRRGDGIRDGR